MDKPNRDWWDRLDDPRHESEWCVWLVIGVVLAAIVFGAVT